jgi:hypothetical protein
LLGVGGGGRDARLPEILTEQFLCPADQHDIPEQHFLLQIAISYSLFCTPPHLLHFSSPCSTPPHSATLFLIMQHSSSPCYSPLNPATLLLTLLHSSSLSARLLTLLHFFSMCRSRPRYATLLTLLHSSLCCAPLPCCTAP